MTGFRVFISSLYYILLLLITVAVHVFVIELLPYPFNQINTIFLVAVGLLILTVNMKNLWICLLFGFVLEFFSTLPFGVVLSALLISGVLVYWILTNVFTHRSLYMVFLTGGIGIFIYRIIIIGIMTFRNFLHHNTIVVDFHKTCIDMIVEVLTTTITLTLFYLLLHAFVKKLRPEYITNSRRLI